MPFAAATLDTAIANTNQRASLGDLPVNSLLLFYITTFNALWPSDLDLNSVNNRTVRNWLVRARLVQNQTPVTGTVQQVQAVVDIACRVMYATSDALTGGRITTAQRDAVLAAWNNSFGLLP
jgi:hypothetical protein